MRLEDAYEEFKIYATKRHKKQYLDTILQNFNKYVLSYFKDRHIVNLTLKDIINWQDYILQFNFSNNYNKNIYCAFNSFLNFCVLNSYIDKNYLSVVGSFKKKYEEHTYNIYTYKEFKKYRKNLDNIVYRYFYDLLFFYGLRSGEAMALKFSDIQGKYLRVGKSIHRRGKREIDTPKTKNSNRTLKLNYIMQLKIFILKCYYDKNFGVNGFDYFIFGGKKPLSPTSLNRHKHVACVKGGIKEITNHEFRHSYATRMLNKHVPINILSKNMGHSSVAITLDVYVHQEKKRTNSLFSSIDFLNTILQNFKKIIQSIITYYM